MCSRMWSTTCTFLHTVMVAVGTTLNRSRAERRDSPIVDLIAVFVSFSLEKEHSVLLKQYSQEVSVHACNVRISS